MMRKIALLVIILLIQGMIAIPTIAQQLQRKPDNVKLPPLTGQVQESDYLNSNREKPTGFIKDSLSGNPVAGAVVSVPDKGIATTTKADGSFKLDLSAHKGNFIVSVKKEGFLPFALSAKVEDLAAPFTLHIEKQQGQIVIDSNLHHLGDNNYSEYSANAGAFRIPSEGPVFVKEFYVEELPPKGMILRIGSIIGLDTIASKELGQSQIDAFSSPLSIFVNSVKIAEIGVNADNKVIPIHAGLLKPHSTNLLVLQTGINQVLSYTGTIDYDDIEFMNLILEIK